MNGSFFAVAIHHAAPEHSDDFLAFMHEVVAATEGAPGLVDFKACRSVDGSFLAGISAWESEEAFRAGLPRIQSLAPNRRPEWSTKPDEVLLLVAA